MSKTAARYFDNYHRAKRKSILDRLVDRLRALLDWYCGVGTE